MMLYAPRLPVSLREVKCPNGGLLLVFRCMLHTTHVTVAGAVGTKEATALCLEAAEALELVEALNAGPSSPMFVATEGAFRQRTVTVKSVGMWGLTVSEAGGFYLTIGLPNAPTAIVELSPDGRARLVSALLELAAGKAAAA